MNDKVTVLENFAVMKINPSGLLCLVVTQSDLLVGCSLNWQACRQKGTLSCAF